MAFGADSAGLLFRIKADSSQAKSEIAGFMGEIGLLDKGLVGLANPAAIAAAAVLAVGAAAVTASVALVKLAFDASDFGSKLQDAAQKTGVGIETIQAFGFAATQAGVSVDKVEASLSKFSVLLGQAELGNKKAQETLAQFGITATDVDSALGQAVTNISAMTSENEKAAASATLFKDKTGAAIAVIREMKGDLPGAIAKLKEMGAMMSEENVEAADKLGDAWAALSTQIKVGATKFALEYAPQITEAITSIGQFVAENKDAWEAWGRGVSNAVTGIIAVLNTLGTAANNILTGITLGLSNQIGAWNIWATAARGALMIVTAGLSEVIYALSEVGRLINANKLAETGGSLMGDQAKGGLGGSFNPGKGRSSSGGGGGGGGGASVVDTAEQERKKAVQAAMDTMRDKIAIYKSQSDEAVAILDEQLSRNAISEYAHLKEIRRAKELEAKYEAQMLAQFARNENLNDDERAEAELKRDIARREARIEELKTQTLINKEFNKANNELFKKIEQQEEFVRLAKEELELLRKKSQLNAAERRLKNYDYDQKLKEKIDRENSETGFGAGLAGGLGQSSIMRDVTDPLTGITQTVADAGQAFTVFGQMAGAAVASVAQGIGNMVQQWVLYGSAGPNAMKKMLASVLAGVAAQAAVLAIMELAYGIAALTPWGFAIYGSPVAHFKAAALFGSVAVGTALGGRAIAGDSFSQSTAGGGSGGSGGGDGAGQPEKLNFTERFNGFQQGLQDQMARVMQRTNEVLGGVTEAVDTFNSKFGITTPGAVVMAGAGDAGEAIFGAVTGHLDSDLRASSNFIRSQGKME